MPGATFMPLTPSGIPGPAGQAAPAGAGSGSVSAAMAAEPVGVSHGAFLLWVVVFGVLVPTLLLGGLRAGGFRFVFVGR